MLRLVVSLRSMIEFPEKARGVYNTRPDLRSTGQSYFVHSLLEEFALGGIIVEWESALDVLYIIARLVLVVPITKLQFITEHANEMASKDLLEAVKAIG